MNAHSMPVPGHEDGDHLRRRAELYFRLASLARKADTAERLQALAHRFAAEAASAARH